MANAYDLDILLPRMGTRLKDLRLARKETLRSVAAKFHLSEATLRKIEQGVYPKVKMTTLWGLTDYYQIPFRDLVVPDED